MRPIEEHDYPRLHPQIYDRRVELKKLVQSVAVAFLDLLQILATAPNSPLRAQRIDDISLQVIRNFIFSLETQLHLSVYPYSPHDQ